MSQVAFFSFQACVGRRLNTALINNGSVFRNDSIYSWYGVIPHNSKSFMNNNHYAYEETKEILNFARKVHSESPIRSDFFSISTDGITFYR